MTERESQVLTAIEGLTAGLGRAPLIVEVARHLKERPQAVHYAVGCLRASGFIEGGAAWSRGLVLVGKCALCGRGDEKK